MIQAILACDQEWGIGKHGALPWPHNPADLKWFKECTSGGVVVMGRKTWDSLPKKPLPGRENIVISSTVKDAPISLSGDIGGALTYIKEMFDHQDIWIIGGAQLIERMLPYIDRIHLSRIEGVYDCDTFLPSEKIIEKFALYNAVETDSGLYIEEWVKK